jgi:hypothetical protein
MTYETELHDEGLCAELVPVATEDGVVDGRCLRPVTGRVFMYRGYGDAEASPTRLPMCEGHAEELVGWGAMSGAEQAAWERRRDAEV